MSYPERWTFDASMREISGFGGGYEAGCRRMLAAGGDYADSHFINWPQVTRASELPDQMQHLMILACEGEDPNGGPTGAMMGAVASHIAYVQRCGWEAWVDEMRRER